MNLQELSSALPKSWLSISAHELKADIFEVDDLEAKNITADAIWAKNEITTGPSGIQVWSNYNPNLTAVSNLSALNNSDYAITTRLGQYLTISGSFKATIAASISAVAFTIDLPSLSASTLGNHRSASSSCNFSGASFIAMSLIDATNISPTQLRFDLRTTTGANQPAAPTVDAVFHYSITLESSVS